MRDVIRSLLATLSLACIVAGCAALLAVWVVPPDTAVETIRTGVILFALGLGFGTSAAYTKD